ncbi:MAG: hypothetical protein ACRCYY_08475, partial [Trueperaceae bacterium]
MVLANDLVFLASELAKRLGSVVSGEDREVTRLASSREPMAGVVVVVPDEKTLQGLESADVAVLVVGEKLTTSTPHPFIPHPFIKVRDTRLALAQLS